MSYPTVSSLVFPVTGPGRTPAGEMRANLFIAHTGLMSLLLAVQDAAPQEQDYAGSGPAAFGIATMEHAACCGALLALEAELTSMIEVVSGARSASDAPASEFSRRAAQVADQPSSFPTFPPGSPGGAALKERLVSVYRCSLTVIQEFRPMTPNARDYESNEDFAMARAQHQAWVLFVQRLGHWFQVLSRSARPL